MGVDKDHLEIFQFLFLIVLSTVIDYTSASMIGEGRVTPAQRRTAGAYLIAAAVGFLTIRWRGESLVPQTLEDFLPLLGTVAFVAVVELLYPRLEALTEERKRKWFIIASVSANLGILGIFKYYNFFAESLTDALSGAFGVTPSARSSGRTASSGRPITLEREPSTPRTKRLPSPWSA